MTKSVRFDPSLESILERTCQALGVSQSEFIREAVAKRCEELSGQSLAERLSPIIGRIKTSGGRAHHTGAAFRRALVRKQPKGS